PFLKRHMRAIRDVQRDDGRFPDIAPIGGGFRGVLWGSAGITVPWELYQQYGDKNVLEDHYNAMKKYIAYLKSLVDEESNILNEKERENFGDLGDWLSPEYEQTEKSLLWESYFLYDLEIMENVAGILG